MTDSVDSTQQQLTINVRPSTDGGTRLIFTLRPSAQVVGEVTVWAGSPQLLPVLAAQFAAWAQQQSGGLQLAGAGTLDQLDKLRPRLNGG